MEFSKGGDLMTSDPEPVDWDYPPAIATVTLNSHGDNLNGIIYISQGQGPHPTVILLHGYPGDEKNLDLAQAIRRAGWNVLFFHYRGAWGSGGVFSIDNALDDVSAALDFLGLPESQRDYRVDPGKIAVVGHSMGAYLALVAGSRLPTVRRIAALAPVNIGQWVARDNPDAWAAIAAAFEMMSHGAVRNASGVEQYAKMSEYPAEYDLLERVANLDGKSLLLVGAARDTDVPPAGNYEPLVNRLRDRNKAKLTSTILDTDHVFSSGRIALARLVSQWLAETLAD